MIDTGKYAIRDAILKHSRDGVIELLREEVNRLRKKLKRRDKRIELLLEEVKRLRKLEAAVVGSWMEACKYGASWHKELRYPCVNLGYLELRDVEHTRKGFDGNTYTYTNREYHLKEEYEEMAKQWIKEEYGVEEE